MNKLIGLLWLTLCAPILHAAQLTDMQLVPHANDQVQLQLTFDETIAAPNAVLIDDPAQLMIDFPGNTHTLAAEEARQVFQNGLVRRLQAASAQGRLRIALDLVERQPFKIALEENKAYITLGQHLESTRQQTHFTDVSGIAQRHGYDIEQIDFRRGAEGQGRIVVGLSDDFADIDLKAMGQKIKVTFSHARLEDVLAKALDVTDFGTPVTEVSTRQVGAHVEMDITTHGYFEHMAYQTDNRFTIEVKPLSHAEAVQAQQVEQYTGERLSLNFQDIGVRAVLQIIAEFTGLNIVTTDDVQGTVTLRLGNVPWDQALALILKTKGLDKRQQGNVLIIAPAAQLAAQERTALEAQQQVEALAPLRSEFFQVNYAKAQDLADLLQDEDATLLTARGHVSVDERTNMLLVQDTPAKLDEVRQLVHRLDVPVKQVLIESRVVVANDDFEHALGVQFGTSFWTRRHKDAQVGVAGNITAADSIVTGDVNPNTLTTAERLNVNLSRTLASTTNSASVGLAIAQLPGDVLINLELSALESEGLGKIISSPRLITANQQMAYIESGEEIPYQEASSSGATVTAFKKAVLRLEVTPQITPDDHIILDLTVNQDSRGTETGGIPAINTDEIHTSVLVKNGQTIVLGGVYKQTKKKEVTRVPFLSRLPGIGWMFRNKRDTDTRSELMIFVTPKIIKGGIVS